MAFPPSRFTADFIRASNPVIVKHEIPNLEPRISTPWHERVESYLNEMLAEYCATMDEMLAENPGTKRRWCDLAGIDPRHALTGIEAICIAALYGQTFLDKRNRSGFSDALMPADLWSKLQSRRQNIELRAHNELSAAHKRVLDCRLVSDYERVEVASTRTGKGPDIDIRTVTIGVIGTSIERSNGIVAKTVLFSRGWRFCIYGRLRDPEPAFSVARNDLTRSETFTGFSSNDAQSYLRDKPNTSIPVELMDAPILRALSDGLEASGVQTDVAFSELRIGPVPSTASEAPSDEDLQRSAATLGLLAHAPSSSSY